MNVTAKCASTDWPVHPAAELFPMLSAEKLADLGSDIAAHGLTDPITLYRDPQQGTMLLDGRNRLAACQQIGITPATCFYEGDDPIRLVISRNMKRRDLTNGQRAALAHRLLPLYETEAKARQGARTDLCADLHTSAVGGADLRHSNGQGSRSADRAAASVGTSGRAVAQFKRLAKQAPDLAEKVKKGAITLNHAEQVLREREAKAVAAEHSTNGTERHPKPKRQATRVPAEPTPAHLRNHHRFDTNREMDNYVARQVKGAQVIAEYLDLDEADPDRIPEWIAALKKSRTMNNRLIKELTLAITP